MLQLGCSRDLRHLQIPTLEESIDRIQATEDGTVVQSSIFNRLTIGFSVLLLVAFVGNLITPTVLHFNIDDYDLAYKLGGLTCGLLLSEFLAIAHWQVFNVGRISVRFSVGIFTSFLLTIGLLIGIQIWPGIPTGFSILLLVMGPTITLIAWGVLALFFHYSPYYRKAAFLHDCQAKPRNQFSIGTLLLWMTLFALAIFLVKAIVPWNEGNWLESRFEYFLLVVWFLWLSLSIALSSWILVVAVLGRSRRWLIAYVLTLSLGPLLFQWLAGTILHQGRLRISWRLENLWLLYTVAIGLAFGNAIIVTMMRFCGMQLENDKPELSDDET